MPADSSPEGMRPVVQLRLHRAGNTATGGTWNNPTAIYTPRFVRWNLTVEF